MDQPKQDEFYEFKPFRVPKYRVKFDNVKNASDVSGYVWFTPAALYLWGRFTEVQLGDIVSRLNVKICWYQFDRPIFTGFEFPGDDSWNRLLWAVSDTSFDAFVSAVLETVQFDHDKKNLYQYALQDLTVVDPLAVDKSPIVSDKTKRLKIKAFAVLSNLRQCAFNRSAGQTGKLPSMASLPASDIHKYAAKRLFFGLQVKPERMPERYKKIMQEDADRRTEDKRQKIRKPS